MVIDNTSKKQNWFMVMVKKYQLVTFTFIVLLLYSALVFLLYYFIDKNILLSLYHFDNIFFIAFFIAFYFLWWLISVTICSKFTKEKLKNELEKHPIITIVVFVLSFINLLSSLLNIPYALGGFIGNVFTAFEIIIYHIFSDSICWLIFCWISNKTLKRNKTNLVWYNNIVEVFLHVVPIVYRIILSIIVIMFLAVFLIMIIYFLGYSGNDISALLAN